MTKHQPNPSAATIANRAAWDSAVNWLIAHGHDRAAQAMREHLNRSTR